MTGMTGVHGVPDLQTIVTAVREFLEQDVATGTTGRTRFNARVATNLLRMVERELELGPSQRARYAEGLARLGVASDAQLALAIRAGRMDDRIAEVKAFVAETVRARLAVANPRHLSGP